MRRNVLVPRTRPIRTPEARILFAGGFVLLVAQAFVPFGEFLHRFDDAYYYFEVARNHVRVGFWSFDGTQPTNGVQPLWALLLTGLAQGAALVGITDMQVLERIFVAFGALVQFAGAVVLYRVVAPEVSHGAGLAAAGALMLPLGMSWGRLSGVESPLLSLALVSVVAYYHGTFRVAPDLHRAAVLGALLGVTCLSRLNAGLLIPVLLGWYVAVGTRDARAARMRHALMAGAVATFLVAPYLLWNLLQTGHALPVSGVVKTIGVERALSEWGASGRLSVKMLSFLYHHWLAPVEWFVSSRVLDGLWIGGVRLLHDGAASLLTTLAVLAAFLTAPMLAGRPREWMAFLRARMARLGAFGYFGVFALLDALVSVGLYPTQTYAIPRWWLVSDELLLIVLGATLCATAVTYVGMQLGVQRRSVLVPAAVVMLVAAHGVQTARWYWDGTQRFHDWNLSWNDDSHAAAEWVNAHVPSGALVGSWNAGVLGAHARPNVVNLDGLVNNAALLPYLREDRMADYIRERHIRYLSDMDGVVRKHVHGLRLTEVYRRRSALMRSDYAIYRVDEQSFAAGGAP